MIQKFHNYIQNANYITNSMQFGRIDVHFEPINYAYRKCPKSLFKPPFRIFIFTITPQILLNIYQTIIFNNKNAVCRGITQKSIDYKVRVRFKG